MHIDRIQAAAMVDHDVVPHGIAVGGCHHLAVVGCIDRCSFRCGEIHAIMELFNSQGRVDTVAIIIRNSGIGCQREFEYTTVIGQHRTAGLQDPLFLCCDRRLQCCDLCILIGDGLFILLDRLFFVGNIALIGGDIPALLVDQGLHIGLLLLHPGLSFIQDLFLRFQFFLTQCNVFTVLHEFFPLLAVICHDQIHEIRPVQEITEALRL